MSFLRSSSSSLSTRLDNDGQPLARGREVLECSNDPLTTDDVSGDHVTTNKSQPTPEDGLPPGGYPSKALGQRSVAGGLPSYPS